MPQWIYDLYCYVLKDNRKIKELHPIGIPGEMDFRVYVKAELAPRASFDWLKNENEIQNMIDKLQEIYERDTEVD